MDNHHIHVEYTIPSLGFITTQIYKPYASLCYNFLDKYDYIKKLKTINQLGVIKNTFNGTHHPRWEYVVLQIYLLNLLKKTEFKSGLASNYKINFKNKIIKISGCELIQIWILLLNSGHLPGTFASERGVLRFLNEKKIFKKTFRKGIPINLRDSFDDMLLKNNIYDVHKFIIAYLLKRHTNYSIYCDEEKLINVSDLLIKCLELFILNTKYDEKLIKYKFYFERIRQLSYLFLDSHYTAFPINFNISQFIFNLENHVAELFSPTSHLNETLSSFDNLLTNDLYNSKESIRELNIHFKYILDKLSSQKLDTLTDIKNLFENNYSIFNPSIKAFDDKNETLYLPFNLGVFLPIINSIADDYFDMDLEIQMNKLIGKRNLLTIQKSSNKRLMTITIVFKAGNYYNHILAIQRLTKKLIFIKNKIIEDNGEYIKLVIDRIFNEAFKEIFLFILNNANKNEDKLFKFDEMDLYPNILSVNTKKDFNNKNTKYLKKSEEYEDEFTEMIAKNNIYKNKALVSFSSVYFYDINDSKQEVHEIDGVILNFKNNTLEIILTEAKNQKNYATKNAKNQLEDAINDINFYTKDLIEIQEEFNPKGAFSIITISNE